MKVRIYHDQQACINCKSCTMLAPTHFGDNQDGQVILIDGQPKEKDSLVFVKEVEVDETEFEEIKSAAESCPVGAIKFEVVKTKKEK